MKNLETPAKTGRVGRYAHHRGLGSVKVNKIWLCGFVVYQFQWYGTNFLIFGYSAPGKILFYLFWLLCNVLFKRKQVRCNNGQCLWKIVFFLSWSSYNLLFKKKNKLRVTLDNTCSQFR